jgi:hypothetical protein
MRQPAAVPSQIECAACGREVHTGREPAVLWESLGWCTGCWFQGPNRLGQAYQQVPRCGFDPLEKSIARGGSGDRSDC